MGDEATKLVNDLRDKIHNALSANACDDEDVEERERVMWNALDVLRIRIVSLEGWGCRLRDFCLKGDKG